MIKDTRAGYNTQIGDEAAEWFVEFRAGDATAESRRAFTDWLRRSPEHLQAYLEIAALWNEGTRLDAERRYDTEALIALAREDNVVPLPVETTVPAAQPPAALAPSWRWFAIAAALATVAVGLFSWLYLNRGIYATDVGEQRSLTLADGSTVQLNSRSRIKVRYSEGGRAIDLVEGQALFQVAKDARRQFIVRSGDAVVRAVGTQFDVYRKHAGTTVTVLEGRVEVERWRAGAAPSAASGSPIERVPGAGSAAGFLLAAGQQVTVAHGTELKPVNANVATATAWTQRQLVFDSATLGEVAEEFNRYNEVQIMLKDADAVDFHISGVFSSTDPASLIRFLQTRRGIEVVETENEIRITQR